MTDQQTTIRQEEFIPASPGEVYDAYLDAGRHTAFTGSPATSDPRVGGKFTAWDQYIHGKYVTLEKDRRIVQQWITRDWPEGAPPSSLELRLEARDQGTHLTMIHSDVPETMMESLRQGWIDYYWEPMKSYFDQN